MTKQAELVERIARDLRSVNEATRVRHLVLVGGEDGWRIGYQVPNDAGARSPGVEPTEWRLLDWLTTADGEPLYWFVAGQAFQKAIDIRATILAAAGSTPGKLLVVISGKAPHPVVV